MGASAYVLIFGTDLALRGRDDSLARCLNGMHKERRFLLYIYQSGVAATVAVATDDAAVHADVHEHVRVRSALVAAHST